MNSGILEKIARRTEQRLAERKNLAPLPEIAGRAERLAEKTRGFEKAISAGPGISIIGELKKRSPSAGNLREGFCAEEIIKSYEESVVRAISIVTEQDFFSGSPEYLSSARKISSKPLLQKDFFIDEYQLYESRLRGADCVLLIARLLDDEKLKAFMNKARILRLDCLIEVHSEDDAARAVDCGAGIVGINNRDLDSFRVCLSTTERLVKALPRGITVVSESGIRSRDDILRLESAGADAVLVGELFMKSGDIRMKAEELLGV